MADIEMVDGKAELPKRHAFVGPTQQSNCDVCGTLRIHSNHKGYNYDMATPPGVKPETIAEEASRIVFGDREQAYDDPNVNFERVAHMWTGTLLRKLLPGSTITPSDVALCLVQLKIAREAHKPSRDNRVDGVGYFLCLERIVGSKTDG